MIVHHAARLLVDMYNSYCQSFHEHSGAEYDGRARYDSNYGVISYEATYPSSSIHPSPVEHDDYMNNHQQQL